MTILQTPSKCEAYLGGGGYGGSALPWINEIYGFQGF